MLTGYICSYGRCSLCVEFSYVPVESRQSREIALTVQPLLLPEDLPTTVEIHLEGGRSPSLDRTSKGTKEEKRAVRGCSGEEPITCATEVLDAVSNPLGQVDELP